MWNIFALAENSEVTRVRLCHMNTVSEAPHPSWFLCIPYLKERCDRVFRNHQYELSRFDAGT